MAIRLWIIDTHIVLVWYYTLGFGEAGWIVIYEYLTNKRLLAEFELNVTVENLLDLKLEDSIFLYKVGIPSYEESLLHYSDMFGCIKGGKFSPNLLEWTMHYRCEFNHLKFIFCFESGFIIGF